MVKYIQFNVYDYSLEGGPEQSLTGHVNVTFTDDNYTIGANSSKVSAGLLYATGSGTDGIIRQENETLARTTRVSKSVPVTDEQYDYLLNYARTQEGRVYDYGALNVACVDFAQVLYEATGQPGHFGNLFSREETGGLVALRIEEGIIIYLGYGTIKDGTVIGGVYVPTGPIPWTNGAPEIREFIKDNCFLAGTMIDMWPLEIQPGPDGRYDEAAIRAAVWQKPIEEIAPSDWVVSVDGQGHLKPGKVVRTMTNAAKIILDFHGTFVTPGHVYWCAGGKYAGRFAPLIDILRDDGIIQRQDGTLIRAATGCEVGSADDEEFWAFTFARDDQGNERIRDKVKLRFGTRWMRPDGGHFSMREHLDAQSVEIIQDGPMRGYARWKESGIVAVFPWSLSETLPRPEDFVLARSATSLDAIYKAGQWEDMEPTMPPPMIMDGGVVRPLPEDGLRMMPRNEPLALKERLANNIIGDKPRINRRCQRTGAAPDHGKETRLH